MSSGGILIEQLVGYVDIMPSDLLQLHAFLQTLMHRGSMPEEEARAMYCELCSVSSDQNYASFIGEVQEMIGDLGYRVARCKYPVNDNMYVAFVDAETDARRSAASGLSPGDARLTPTQILYFRTALELVVSSPHAAVVPSAGNLPALAARHLLNTPLAPSETAGRPSQGPGDDTQATPSTQGTAPKLTVGEKQALLDRFVHTEWLAEVPGVAGHYTLGVRACMELVPRLVDLPDVSKDVLCALQRLL